MDSMPSDTHCPQPDLANLKAIADGSCSEEDICTFVAQTSRRRVVSDHSTAPDLVVKMRAIEVTIHCTSSPHLSYLVQYMHGT